MTNVLFNLPKTDFYPVIRGFYPKNEKPKTAYIWLVFGAVETKNHLYVGRFWFLPEQWMDYHISVPR
jgi:hypothetical protein